MYGHSHTDSTRGYTIDAPHAAVSMGVAEVLRCSLYGSLMQCSTCLHLYLCLSQPSLAITLYPCFSLSHHAGFVHAAFTFAYESMLGRSNIRNAEKTIPPGALISFLQKGLQYVGIEESLYQEGPHGNKRKAPQENFTLLSPQTMHALTRQNPPIQINVPPATAAAAIKARLETEAKLEAAANAAVMAAATEQAFTGQSAAMATHSQQALQQFGAVAAHAAAANAMSQLQQSGVLNGHDAFPAGSAGAAAFAAQRDAMNRPQRDVAAAQHQAAAALASVAEHQPARTTGSVKRSKKSQSADSSSSSSTKQTPAVPLHLQQSGMPVHGFAHLEEAVARLEAQRNATPMDIDGSKDMMQVKSQDLRNGGGRPVDQNGEGNAMELPLNGRGGPARSTELMAATVLSGVSHQQQDATRQMRAAESGESIIDLEDEKTKALPAEVLELKKHASEVFMCAWNPVFTKLIATGSGDASARIWEMGGTDAKAGCAAVRLLPHGTDPNDRKNKDVTTLEWSPDGLLLATGSYDGIARVWNRAGVLVHTLRGHEGPIFSLKWNRSGNFLLSGSYDKTTIVWDVSGNQGFIEQKFNDHSAPALDVDWKDDTTFASCSTDKTVNICRVGVPHPLKTYTGHNDEVNAVKWDPSGTLLASCSDDCTAKVWEVASDRNDPLFDFKSHQQEIYTVKWYVHR